MGDGLVQGAECKSGPQQQAETESRQGREDSLSLARWARSSGLVAHSQGSEEAVVVSLQVGPWSSQGAAGPWGVESVEVQLRLNPGSAGGGSPLPMHARRRPKAGSAQPGVS